MLDSLVTQKNSFEQHSFSLDIDIEFQRGNFHLAVNKTLNSLITGLVGTSGSGKSTLLALLAGLLKPTKGKIVLNKRVLFDSEKHIFVPPHQRKIGLVFQDRQLFPHLNVKNNLLYGYKNIAEAQHKFTLAHVVELLELGNLLERKPRHLSGGEQQRVALGRAILYSPDLLLLDEPLSALDTQLKQQILPFLSRLRDLHLPMIYVSHALSEIEFLTKICMTIKEGKMHDGKVQDEKMYD